MKTFIVAKIIGSENWKIISMAKIICGDNWKLSRRLNFLRRKLSTFYKNDWLGHGKLLLVGKDKSAVKLKLLLTKTFGKNNLEWKVSSATRKIRSEVWKVWRGKNNLEWRFIWRNFRRLKTCSDKKNSQLSKLSRDKSLHETLLDDKNNLLRKLRIYFSPRDFSVDKNFQPRKLLSADENNLQSKLKTSSARNYLSRENEQWKELLRTKLSQAIKVIWGW
jgi:hypothetical protein